MKQSAAGVSAVMRKLSAHIAQAARRPLPPKVAERAKHHLLDTLAAMVSGSPLLPGRRAIEYIAAQGGVREATVIGSRIVTTAVNAALANGMLAHADETDDAYYIALVHPGCAVVPAALAMAERAGRGGTALLRAIVVGYDVCARISKALGVESFRSAGFSTHSYGGVFGAAAAAGALAGINADQARYLLSYTAQQASGLSCWARDTEHIEKAFDFGGMPARNGVTAATMVALPGSRTCSRATAASSTPTDAGRSPSFSFVASVANSTSCRPRSSAGRWAIPSRRRSTRCRT